MATYKILGIEDVQIGYKVTGPDAIVDQDYPFANAFQINPQTQELTYEGDMASEYVSINLGLRGTMAADKFETLVLEKALGMTDSTTGRVTAGLPGDESIRYYPESGTYPFLRLRVKLLAINETTQARQRLRLEVFRAQIQPTPWAPGNAASAAKLPMEMGWTAIRTSVDLINVALPGVTSGGAFYSVAVLT
jgi:hypothetical protein